MPTKRNKTPRVPQTVTLQLSRTTIDGNVIENITIPKAWRVTFGPLFPGKPGQYHRGEQGYYLRLWDKQTQRACISGVHGFRDVTHTVAEVFPLSSRTAGTAAVAEPQPAPVAYAEAPNLW